MGVLINWLRRFIESPKTTLGGLLGGTAIGAAIIAVFGQAGCNFSSVQWFEILGIAMGGGTIIGGLSTDEGKTVVKPPTP